MSRQFSPDRTDAIPLKVVDPEGLEAALNALPPEQAAWARGMGFDAGLGDICTLPDGAGGIGLVLLGHGTREARARKRFAMGAAVAGLPEGLYRLDDVLDGPEAEELALGFLLAGYRFGRYKTAPDPKARLVAPAGVDAARLERIAAGECLTRDLINTPANDMGPDALEAAVRDLAGGFGATVSVTGGEDLLDANLPLIHAVGRASDRAPRLIDMTWGSEGPH
jgi:leucyl aminopeptidase